MHETHRKELNTFLTLNFQLFTDEFIKKANFPELRRNSLVFKCHPNKIPEELNDYKDAKNLFPENTEKAEKAA